MKTAARSNAARLAALPSQQLPPGPVGTLVKILAGDFAVLPFMERGFQDYGDMFSFRIGPALIVQVAHPHDIERLLVGYPKQLLKDVATRDLGLILGRGLLTSDGDLWRRQRKLAAPSFTRKHVHRYAQVMTRAARRGTFTRFDRVKVGDIHPHMMAMALDVVLGTLFGDELGDGIVEPQRVAELLEVFMDAVLQRSSSWEQLVPPHWPLPGSRRAIAARAELDVMLDALVDRARHSGAVGDELLHRLLRATDEQGRSMDTALLRDELATVFLAGHETTGLSLSFTLHLLTQHPSVMARTVAEIDAVVGAAPLELAHLDRLAYLDAVVKESLRLLPPAWAIGREPTETIELGGYPIPPGTQLLLPQWIVHRDPRWYDEPLRYWPERWLEGSTVDRARPRMAYFPFGGGHRICVGNHFALLEAKLMLATLLQHVEFRAEPGFELDLLPAVTLRPAHGVQLWSAPRRRRTRTP